MKGIEKMECNVKDCFRHEDCSYLDIFKKQPDMKKRPCSYFSPTPKKSKEEIEIPKKPKK